MNSRQRIRNIIARKEADRCGFWLGNPLPETWAIYHDYFGTSTEQELRQKLGDDFRWIPPELFESTYAHPEGNKIFHVEKQSHGEQGPFAQTKDIKEIDDYEWPNPEYLNFDEYLKALDEAGDFYRAGGFWTPFYHHVMDLFGMESYLMNMYDNPELVNAVTGRVCGFYYEANERLFKAAGNRIDGFFFGNDFGTQRDLICGLKQFDEFILPWFGKFTELAHRYGYQVILHSCGAIHRVIERLIDLGVDCLHPLQAKANNMDADTLAKDFGNRISFLGGIDTQDLLVNAAPEQIKTDVKRVKVAMGPWLIVSPSHEALLPNVPPANVQAMAEAVNESQT